MHTQTSNPGFLAIHPPRRLWPDFPVFLSNSLPGAVKKLQPPQKKPQK